MKDKESFYAVIPANVRYCDNLTPRAKLLYGEITALCNKKGFCWATNKHFAKLYNVNKWTISKWINSLQRNGFIRCSFKNKNMRRIHVKYNTKGLCKITRGVVKNHKGGSEKSQRSYNTTSNTKSNISVSAKSSFEMRCVKKLYSAIKTKRKINKTIKKKEGVVHFRKLLKSEVKKQRIAKVLTWYTHHLGEEYVPVAYSARGFCKKFLRIEDAMERENKKTKQGKTPTEYVDEVVR